MTKLTAKGLSAVGRPSNVILRILKADWAYFKTRSLEWWVIVILIVTTCYGAYLITRR